MNIENSVSICPPYWSGNPNDPAAPDAPDVCSECKEPDRRVFRPCAQPHCAKDSLCHYCRHECPECGKVFCNQHRANCECEAARKAEEEEKRSKAA
jgi:hypothetical protein